VNVTRNLGFLTRAEQRLLSDSVVAIAGAGGDGGKLALTLARLGVGGFRLADPEPFEAENLNRQAGCTTKTLGRNKAAVIAELISEINPSAEVTVYTDGVTEDNVDEFVLGSSIVADEMEYTLPSLAVMLARASRKRDLVVVMGYNIGFGALVTSFRPGGMTVERAWGLSEDASLAEIATQKVPLSRQVARLPGYWSYDLLTTLQEGRASAPSLAPGVDLAAGMTATAIVAELVGRGHPPAAPQARWYDALEGKSGLVRWPQASFARSLLPMARRFARGITA